MYISNMVTLLYFIQILNINIHIFKILFKVTVANVVSYIF